MVKVKVKRQISRRKCLTLQLRFLFPTADTFKVRQKSHFIHEHKTEFCCCRTELFVGGKKKKEESDILIGELYISLLISMLISMLISVQKFTDESCQ